eukprot:scaffold11447_cov100-Skeletonema_dohrnii-CCMP3373.AAC.1
MGVLCKKAPASAFFLGFCYYVHHGNRATFTLSLDLLTLRIHSFLSIHEKAEETGQLYAMTTLRPILTVVHGRAPRGAAS